MSLRHVAPVALIVLLAGCGSSEAASKPAAITTATQLPDGSTATMEQAAYLDAVKPAMTPAHAADPLGLLRDGADVCGISKTYALNLLQTSGGYNLTEATAIANTAPRYLCSQ